MLLVGGVLAAVWGMVWALFLQFSQIGQFLAVKRTWLTVVIGVGVDLLIALLVVPWAYWLPFVVIIALSSIGLIVRSLYNEKTENDVEITETINAFKDPHPK